MATERPHLAELVPSSCLESFNISRPQNGSFVDHTHSSLLCYNFFSFASADVHAPPVLVTVTLVMTAQTMSFHYELTCKGFSTEKEHHPVTQRNDLCCFIGLTFTASLKRSIFLQLSLVKMHL